MDASARWAELMDLPEDRVPLDEAALLISARANPDLDVHSQLRRLDSVASEVRGAGIDELCRLLFDRIGLHGDRSATTIPTTPISTGFWTAGGGYRSRCRCCSSRSAAAAASASRG